MFCISLLDGIMRLYSREEYEFPKNCGILISISKTNKCTLECMTCNLFSSLITSFPLGKEVRCGMGTRLIQNSAPHRKLWYYGVK